MRSYRKRFISDPAFNVIMETPPDFGDQKFREVYFPFGKNHMFQHYDLNGKFHLLSGAEDGIKPAFGAWHLLDTSFFPAHVVRIINVVDLATFIFPFDDYSNHPLD